MLHKKLPHFRRETHVIRELGGVGVVNRKAQSFANAASSLVDGSPVAVDTRNTDHARDPPSLFVTLVDHFVVAHRSQPFPKHGARSRSMARSVPIGTSLLP